MIREYYMDDPRTPEERNADAHLLDMINADGEFRSKNPKLNAFPLEYNQFALISLRNYYLGTLHPAKHPDHANNLAQYKSNIAKETPHLLPHLPTANP